MGRYAGGGKRTVESTPVIDIGAVRRACIFASPRERQLRAWHVDNSIVELAPITSDGHQLITRNLAIPISRTLCRFGGERFLFACGCGRRVTKLYSPR
jgi:hypothetical protein